MKKIRFSVVIPLFNKSESITETLQSVLAQKHPAEEIIVVDDGSTDGSAEVVKKLDIANLTIIEQANAGVSAARNRGADAATGNYIAFLDADDIWSPFYLAKMHSLIETFPDAKCYGAGYQKQLGDNHYVLPKVRVDANPQGALLHDYFKILGNGDLPFMMSSSVFERNFYTEIGGCPLGEAMGEDQSLFACAALETVIAFTPLVLLSYRTDSENRACERILPSEPLPFVNRLVKRGQLAPVTLRNDLYRYAAAVVCQLAKQNLLKGYSTAAMNLLSYPPARHKPLHWLVLNVASMFVQSINRMSKLRGDAV